MKSLTSSDIKTTISKVRRLAKDIIATRCACGAAHPMEYVYAETPEETASHVEGCPKVYADRILQALGGRPLFKKVG